ncbi:MAG: hypothetical protein A4E31_00085 [Methanomassiliicoccales archaeon PtaU1.Bin030]|nr:MAG: hypothetical protein A4E31_00085 [Methanomassiliicoccales archaeon PtaU1.Bin030]
MCTAPAPKNHRNSLEAGTRAEGGLICPGEDETVTRVVLLLTSSGKVLRVVKLPINEQRSASCMERSVASGSLTALFSE